MSGRALWLAPLLASGVAGAFAGCATPEPVSPNAATTGEEAPPDVPAPAPATEAQVHCPTFESGIALGQVDSDRVLEASGIAASRKNPGLLWTHNDSGDSARLIALATDGTLIGEFPCADALAFDWEDIAVGPGPEPGESYIYIGDIGDNFRNRKSVQIYRVREPTLRRGEEPLTQTLGDVERIEVRYPDGPVDAETLLIDPDGGDLLIVSKNFTATNTVYRIAAPHESGRDHEAVPVGTIQGGLTTAGDVSPDGGEIIVKNYNHAFLWTRPAGTELWKAFDSAPCPIPLEVEGQGEALAYAVDGSGYFTLGEGATQPVYFFKRRPAP